ncbi:DUF1493 family protein [Enterobacteriaceae bacterium 89]|nr:DUF1493 family protein [Enterobacteriaceae bacterium 89]
MLPDENELLQYLTENYSERKRPVKKEWTFQEHFNFPPEDLEDMILDLFTRYGIEYDSFVLDNYFEPEIFWWQWKLRKQWQERQLKPLTVEMLIESAKAGKWLYD